VRRVCPDHHPAQRQVAPAAVPVQKMIRAARVSDLELAPPPTESPASPDLPHEPDLELDWTVTMLSCGIALTAGEASGLLDAWASSPREVYACLRVIRQRPQKHGTRQM